eukprot:109698-Pyramimonas_sp.AAC.1
MWGQPTLPGQTRPGGDVESSHMEARRCTARQEATELSQIAAGVVEFEDEADALLILEHKHHKQAVGDAAQHDLGGAAPPTPRRTTQWFDGMLHNGFILALGYHISGCQRRDVEDHIRQIIQ